MKSENRIAIHRSRTMLYPNEAPFNPTEPYSEYSIRGCLSSEKNEVYEGIRNVFVMLGFDNENIGKSCWNPLSEFIKPGDKVLIKPNLVREYHGRGLGTESVVTHASVIRAIVDYVFKACGHNGEITIADSPVFGAVEVEKMAKTFGLDQVVNLYARNMAFPITLCDLRTRKAISRGQGMVIIDRVDLPGDPKGYTKVRLGAHSEFCEIEENKRRLRGGDYDNTVTMNHHENGQHEYLVANSALDADVVINVPKLKVHKKAGISVSLKNMIGIFGDKNWIPHFMLGSDFRGGDEYPYSGLLREAENILKDRFLRSMYNASKPVLNLAQLISKAHKTFVSTTGFASIRSGSWYGNDTIWRSILDINKIVLFADKQGIMRDTPQRRLFSVVDGVIAGEDDGPLSPTPKPAGILCGGNDWAAVDIVLATYMGFDYLKIPQLAKALGLTDFRFTSFENGKLEIFTNFKKNFSTLDDFSACADPFLIPKGWRGHIERAINRSSTGQSHA